MEKVVIYEEIGKNKWYSLTASGRLLATQRLGRDIIDDEPKYFLRDKLATILKKLDKNISENNSYEVNNIVLDARNIINESHTKYAETSLCIELLEIISRMAPLNAKTITEQREELSDDLKKAEEIFEITMKEPNKKMQITRVY